MLVSMDRELPQTQFFSPTCGAEDNFLPNSHLELTSYHASYDYHEQREDVPVSGFPTNCHSDSDNSYMSPEVSTDCGQSELISKSEKKSFTPFKLKFMGSGEEEDRRRRRRERNKVAATKCRLKKKDHVLRLHSESQVLENNNICLRGQVGELQHEASRLVKLLTSHEPFCLKVSR